MQPARRRRSRSPAGPGRAASGRAISRPRREPTSGSSRCPGCCRGFGPAGCSRSATPSRSPPTSPLSSRPTPGELVGVDLAEAEVPGFETVVADARELPFPDASFDQVLLVSTLEHIGADNEVYGVDERARRHGTGGGAPRAPPGPAPVRQPARDRAARRAGRLRLVPAGGHRAAGHGSSPAPGSSSRSRRRTSSATRAGAPRRRSTPTGVVYGTRGPAASAVLCAELSPRRLRRLVSPDGVRRTARRRLGPSYRRLRGPP